MAQADADQDMGERDNDEPNEFPPAERTIHTQSYDMSINTLKEQWDDGLLIVPDFQRDFVWDKAKSSRLIESLLLNIPIPVLYFSENESAQYEVVDGHQRVRSVVAFLANEFPLSGLRIQEELRGLRFHELPLREQRFLKTRVMRAVIIGSDSSPTMKFEVFERLNTGGLALNAQEIRNALNGGSFNDLLKRLGSSEEYLAALSLKGPRKRMVENELILRFFALRDSLATYRTPLVRFLNDYMRENRNQKADWLQQRETLLLETLFSVRTVLGEGAFRVCDSAGRPTEKTINRSLVEAEALAFSIADVQQLLSERELVRGAVFALFDNDDFRDAISRATGDRVRTLKRVNLVIQAIESSGVSVDRAAFGDVRWPD